MRHIYGENAYSASMMARQDGTVIIIINPKQQSQNFLGGGSTQSMI
jgi:hypothetical protein